MSQHVATMSLALTIITPERRFHFPGLRLIVFPSPLGETGVLPGHATFISLSACGILRIYPEDAHPDDPPLCFAVGSGSLRFFDERLIMLVKRIRREDQLDIDATHAELDEWTKTFGTLDPVLDKENFDDCARAIRFCEAMLALDCELAQRNPNRPKSKFIR